MIGCQGRKVPPSKVVAPTYSATSTGGREMPIPRANRIQKPGCAGGAYVTAALVGDIENLVDVLDIRASRAGSGCSQAIQSPIPWADLHPTAYPMVQAIPMSVIPTVLATETPTEIQIVANPIVVVRIERNCLLVAAVTGVADCGRSRLRSVRPARQAAA